MLLAVTSVKERGGQEEVEGELNYNAVAAEASVHRLGNSGAGIAFQYCPELTQGDYFLNLCKNQSLKKKKEGKLDFKI